MRSYGDHLPQGVFAVHSTFISCVNLVSLDGENALLSLVHPSIGNGPFNVVLDPFEIGEIGGHSIEYTFDGEIEIEIGGHSIEHMFDSRIGGSGFPSRTVTADCVLATLGTLMDCHLRGPFATVNRRLDGDACGTGVIGSSGESVGRGAAGSVVEPLGRGESASVGEPSERGAGACAPVAGHRMAVADGAFERGLRRRLVGGLRHLYQGDLAAATATFRGAGFGLTPSGDDFVCGLLISSHLAEEALGTDLSNEREVIYRASLGGNVLSNAFLGAARNGWLNEHTMGVVCALWCGEPQALEAALPALLDHGETSGSDVLAGLTHGIQYWFGI